MPTESLSTLPRRSPLSWLNARALWAGVSITTMWLAILFVGLWGGNILSSTPGGTSTSVPVVIAVVPFALIGTIAVAHSGLRDAVRTTRGQIPEPQEREAPQPGMPDATALRAQRG